MVGVFKLRCQIHKIKKINVTPNKGLHGCALWLKGHVGQINKHFVWLSWLIKQVVTHEVVESHRYRVHNGAVPVQRCVFDFGQENPDSCWLTTRNRAGNWGKSRCLDAFVIYFFVCEFGSKYLCCKFKFRVTEMFLYVGYKYYGKQPKCYYFENDSLFIHLVK